MVLLLMISGAGSGPREGVRPRPPPAREPQQPLLQDAGPAQQIGGLHATQGGAGQIREQALRASRAAHDGRDGAILPQQNAQKLSAHIPDVQTHGGAQSLSQ